MCSLFILNVFTVQNECVMCSLFMLNVFIIYSEGEGFCAQSWEEFLTSAQNTGFSHPRLVKIASIVVGEEVRAKLGIKKSIFLQDISCVITSMYNSFIR